MLAYRPTDHLAVLHDFDEEIKAFIRTYNRKAFKEGNHYDSLAAAVNTWYRHGVNAYCRPWIGKQLRAARLLQGPAQQVRVAAEAGTDQSTLSRFETGRAGSMDLVIPIITALDVEPISLWLPSRFRRVLAGKARAVEEIRYNVIKPERSATAKMGLGPEKCFWIEQLEGNPRWHELMGEVQDVQRKLTQAAKSSRDREVAARELEMCLDKASIIFECIALAFKAYTDQSGEEQPEGPSQRYSWMFELWRNWWESYRVYDAVTAYSLASKRKNDDEDVKSGNV